MSVEEFQRHKWGNSSEQPGWAYLIVKIFETTNRETHRPDNQ
jgi:hypothetical protein